jgi:2-polyprenyl-3-methyl-5-hydroxy-6-metoxy-1,4-benzoquinol methylase
MISSKLFDKRDYKMSQYAEIKAYFEGWWTILKDERITFSYSNLNRAWEYGQIFNSAGFVGKRVLDLGTCKSLAPIYMVRRLMCEVTTFDMAFVSDRERLYTASGVRDHVQIDQGDLFKPLPYESETFDCVTAFSTIEHVTDHAMMVKEMKRVCKKSGYICLTTDYMEGAVTAIKSGTTFNEGQLEQLIKDFSLPILGEKNYHNVDIKNQEELAVEGKYTFASLVMQNL